MDEIISKLYELKSLMEKEYKNSVELGERLYYNTVIGSIQLMIEENEKLKKWKER